MAEWRALHISFKEHFIQHNSKDERIHIPLVVSIRNEDPSSVEMRVRQTVALKAHIARLLAPATVMDCWQMRTEPCDFTRSTTAGKVYRPARVDEGTRSNRQQASLVSHLACAVLEGSRTLLNDKAPKLTWSDDLEEHKPNEGYLDLSKLWTQCEVYGQLTSHRLRQNTILKSFLHLAGDSGLVSDEKMGSRSFSSLARILVRVINNLSHVHGETAYNVCAAIAGGLPTYSKINNQD